MERKKILRVGDSVAITLPSKFVRAAHWKPGEEVLVDADAGTETVVIRSAKRAMKTQISSEFASWVEEFISEHEPLLKELAKK